MIFKGNKIKVLFLSKKDFAGSGVKLSKSLNLFSDKYESRFVAMNKANFGVENDIIEKNRKKLQSYINECDIVHLKGDEPLDFYKRILDFSGKILFQTVGGSNFRKATNPNYVKEVTTLKYVNADYSNVNLSGITPELTDVWIPHAIEIKDNVWIKPIDKIRIGHSPSDRTKKGTDIIIEALKDIENIEFVLMENMTNKEVLEVKKTLHLFIDQIFIDAYGMSAVECLSMGIPVISSCKEIKDCPIYRIEKPTVEEVEKVVKKAIKELSQSTSNKAYKWAENTHSLKSVCLKIEEFYKLSNKNKMKNPIKNTVVFISNGSFFKVGKYQLKESKAKQFEAKGYGKIEKPEPIKEVKPKQTRAKKTK